jgi:hypothetical protein
MTTKGQQPIKHSGAPGEKIRSVVRGLGNDLFGAGVPSTAAAVGSACVGALFLADTVSRIDAADVAIVVANFGAVGFNFLVSHRIRKRNTEALLRRGQGYPA